MGGYTRDWREERRFLAWELKQQGWKQRDIARTLGVTDGAVSQWVKTAREKGCKALHTRRGGGPKQRLSTHQMGLLSKYLERGARQFGFTDDTWTYTRVAVVIKREFGVVYTPTHAGRILRKLTAR